MTVRLRVAAIGAAALLSALPLTARAAAPAPHAVLNDANSCSLAGGAQALLTASQTTLTAGGQTTVLGSGWAPDSTPEIHIEGQRNGATTFLTHVLNDGSFSVGVVSSPSVSTVVVTATCGSTQKQVQIAVVGASAVGGSSSFPWGALLIALLIGGAMGFLLLARPLKPAGLTRKKKK